MSQAQIDILQRALQREKAARKQAEKILEQKSAELYEANQKLAKSNADLESLLKRTDSQLQGVFENIVDAYVIIDLEGNILKMNDAAVSLLGFPNANVEFNLNDMVDPKDSKRVYQSFEELYKEGFLTDFQVNIITKRNEQKLVHINASTIYDNGVAVAAQGIVRDITLESKYKNSLEAEKQKYYNIISNMNLGLIEFDIDDKILMVNQSTLNMTGYSEEELIGQVGRDIIPIQEDLELIDAKIQERKTGKSDSYEVRIENKAGEVRHWLVSGAPNYDINGKIIGYIGINFDITEIKNLQDQKESLLKKLEKSNNELHEYAHIVSHDLKSPLRSIYALLSWIKEDNVDKLDNKSLQNISLIEVTLEKMEQLITDILEYSSIDQDSSEKSNVDLQEMVHELIKILYIPENINIQIPEKLPQVLGYKTKLQQLFQNLISNAVKFNDKANGLIEILFEENPSYYQFSVKDNGVGIEKQFHDKIFKIFHSLNKSKDSSGIGLSIVKKIVDLHHGEIWLESEPGSGTTFYFTLKK